MRTALAGAALAALAAPVFGCDFGVGPDDLVTGPEVTAFRRTPDGFARISTVAPAAALDGLLVPRAATGEPTLVGGIDRLYLLIDFGADVDLPADADLPAPVLRVTADGLAVPVVATVDERRVDGGRAAIEASFMTPPTVASALAVAIDFEDGFAGRLDDSFAVVDPTVTLDVAQCAGQPTCALPGAVGVASVAVTVPGAITPQTVVLHTALDGVPAATSVSVPTTVTTAGAVGTGRVPVPAARIGATWTIAAQLGRTVTLPETITLTRPDIDAKLACDPSCALAPRAPATLEISAPLAIVSRQAIVQSRIDGVLVSADTAVELINEDEATQTVTRAWSITAPPTTGLWQIDVSVAGYRADSLQYTIAE